MNAKGINPHLGEATEEPTFLLRGRDALAPSLLREWARRALDKDYPLDRVHAALDQADEMERWQARQTSSTPKG